MRSNPDPNPPEIVDDPEKNFKKDASSSKSSSSFLLRSTSLPSGYIQDIEGIRFDEDYNPILLRSKSENDLPKLGLDSTF